VSDILVNFGLIALSIALLLAAMAAVKVIGRAADLEKETQRKLVHVSTGLYALTIPLTFHDRWPVVALIGISIAVMLALRLPRFAQGGLSSTLHAVERKSYGEIYLAAAVGFLFFQSRDEPILYVLPILTLTLSDAAAALVGTSYGRKRFAVEAGVKSVEGVVAFFVVTWLLSMILLLAMTDAPRNVVILLSFLVAAFGALVEADSWRGLDNLFVPLSVHFLLVGRLDASIAGLVALGAIFVISVTAIAVAASALGLSRHAARAYGILFFLVCSITAPRNAILAALAIFAHALAHRVRPSNSPYPDLDLLATIAGVSVFWLFTGEFFGHSAIDLYDLTFAGLTAAFLALAFNGATRWLYPLAFVGLLFLSLELTGWSSAASDWHGKFWPWVAASVLFCLAVPARWPEAFDRQRSGRALALAAAAPLALYVWKGVFA
jgi:dolichol kinase